MVDRKPPRLVGDERQTLCALLQYQRDSFVRKVSGVEEAAARRELVGSGTTLLWLTRHMAQAEAVWVARRFAGNGGEIPDDRVDPQDTLSAAIESYRQIWARTDAIVAAAPNLEQRCADVGEDPPVNLRWVLAHLLEETARHAGHADILREMLDGETGR